MSSSAVDLADDVVWGPVKDILRSMYLEQDLSLTKVMHEMATKHHFIATKYQYEVHFKQWKFRKNRTAGEWRIIANKVTKRHQEGKRSRVIQNGTVINPKKLRKETSRYVSLRAAVALSPSAQSPPTPEGFLICTPSPILTNSISTTIMPSYIHPTVTIDPVLMDCLPFRQFDTVFGQQGNAFLCFPGNDRFSSLALSSDVISSSLKHLARNDDKKISPFGANIKALLPENIFPDTNSLTALYTATSPGQSASALQLLRFTLYLVSNNLLEIAEVDSKKVYEWITQPLNTGLLEHLLSVGGPTVGTILENLFRLSIDAEDYRLTKKMIELGINPNEQVYYDSDGECYTPLHRACELHSLKLVKTLIDGGASVTFSNDNESVLLSAMYSFRKDCHFEDHAELVKILLDAGAAVNPASVENPLIVAVRLGQVEVVSLLISAGADVNSKMVWGDDGDDDYWSSNPLCEVAKSCTFIPITDAISMARILLSAGADPQRTVVIRGVEITALEAATKSKSIEFIQLLLENGARVTESSFVAGVRSCSIDVVKLLLKFGGQVTEKVIESAAKRKDALVFFLLETVEVRLKQRYKSAALIKGIESNNMDLILKLSASGTQLKSTSSLNDAIQQLIKAGGEDVLRFLLARDSGYQSQCLESLEDTLLTAVRAGKNEIVQLLLTVGADVSSTEDSLLLRAIEKKDARLVHQLLVAGTAVNGVMQYSSWHRQRLKIAVLPAAVDWGRHSLIQELIDAGADIDAQDHNTGRTALFLAVYKKDAACIKLLIDAGANVNAPEAISTGRTALNAACYNNDLQLVQYLLDLGADSDEWSLRSAISGSLELVQTLLVARFDRYKRYSQGYGCSALQRAIRVNNATMIRTLLEAGIDPNFIIYYHETERFVSSLAPRFAPDFELSSLGSAIRHDKSGDLWILKMFLRGGANPNSIVAKDHKTALLLAIEENNLAAVKLLITAGADANQSLRLGVQRTPLQLAAENGRLEIVAKLLESGADINAPPFDRYGATALQFSAIGGYIVICRLLIERGADVNAPPANIGGRTALEGAAEHGRIDILQLLLNAGGTIIGAGVTQYERARKFALEHGHRAASRLLEKCKRDLEILENFSPVGDMSMDFI